MLGITISTTCFTFGLLADITSSTTCFTIKNYIALVAAPIEIVISILYWGLRAIDTSLVVPPYATHPPTFFCVVTDKSHHSDLPLPPLIYDLTFHFFPALLLTLDTLLLSPPWPSSPMNPNAPLISLVTSTAIAFLYWWWIEVCYSYNGFYPYPVFALLTTAQRIGLFAMSGATMWVVGGALRAAYAWTNGFEDVSELKRARKVIGGKRE
jgi:hypothetical protein